MPTHVIIITDSFMEDNTAILDTVEITQSQTARIIWLWDSEDIIVVDKSDTWDTIGANVRKILDAQGALASHTKLVVFPKDGELGGKIAKPEAQVSVIFHGCPKLKTSTLNLVKRIAEWGVSNAHLTTAGARYHYSASR